MTLTDADRVIAAKSLRNYATMLVTDNLATLGHIARLRRIADEIDPQTVLPIDEIAVPA